MAAVPPPLDYASRRPGYSIADGRAFVAGCGLICVATVVAAIVGVATTFVLHEVFVFCFGK